MKDGLEPCPFCGADAMRYPDGDMEGYSVMCSGKHALFGATRECCPLAGSFGYATQEDADKAWNRRGPSPPGFNIQRMELMPDDVIVLSVPEPISAELAERLTEQVHRIVGEDRRARVLVLSGGMQIGTLHSSKEVWCHVASGGLYEILHSANIEKEGEQGAKQVVYRSMQSGAVWIRPAAEFYDGRFAPVVEKSGGS